MNNAQKAQTIIYTEQLRLIETELFQLVSKYGVNTVNELDKLIVQGKLSEAAIGEDLFLFDHLLTERRRNRFDATCPLPRLKNLT